VFSSMDSNAALLGWGVDEYSLVQTSSSHSIFVNGADFAINLSTLSNYQTSLSQRTHTTANTIPNVHTVTFVFTDGDNFSWTLNNFATSTNWYGSPHRGKVDIGWTLSCAIAELAPTWGSYLYENAANNATGKDFFIAAASGVGYMYPEYYPDLVEFADLTAKFMQKSDLQIVNILGMNPAAQFVSPFLEQENIDAIFYYMFNDYSGLNGSISWVNGKPVIGGRFNLWQGFETPESLAEKLNAMPTNTEISEGYSLIPVHAWSMTVDSVIECQSLLNPNVRVVKPDEFVQLIQQNIPEVN